MSTKKKLVIGICSLCAVVLLAVFTLVAVFAAENQKVKSQVSITYKATNVAATINGDFILKNDESFTSMGAPIEFLPTTETGTETLGLNGVALNEVKNYAILRYSFKNNSASVKINVETNITASNSTNVTVTYLVHSEEITDYNFISGTTLDNFVIDYSGTAYVYVKIKITDLSGDANFSCSFNFDLSKKE